MVETADLLIVEASFPSTGLGIEMQIAEGKDIPVIICFKDYGINKAEPVTYENPNHEKFNLQIGKGYVSLMALGMPGIFKVLEYHNPDLSILDIAEMVKILASKD